MLFTLIAYRLGVDQQSRIAIGGLEIQLAQVFTGIPAYIEHVATGQTSHRVSAVGRTLIQLDQTLQHSLTHRQLSEHRLGVFPLSPEPIHYFGIILVFHVAVRVINGDAPVGVDNIVDLGSWRGAGGHGVLFGG